MAKLRNLITDVPGVLVGHATDLKLGSGATAVVFEAPAVASADVRGGGTGTRELDLLDPAATVERVDAFALSGGSAFGLETGAGVAAYLAEQGRGFAVRTARIPIVPGAILFDLLNGGDKAWGRYPPYRELGYEAAKSAAIDFALGSVGAGAGASTQNLQGGVGSASARTENGAIVGALAAVNTAGRVTIGDSHHFWAAPYEQGAEFGGHGWPAKFPADAHIPHLKGRIRENTTLAVIATDAALTKPQAKRLAVMASAGLARAIYPVFSPLDGDIVFAAATGKRELADAVHGLAELGAAAANALARAIARAVFEAKTHAFAGAPPSWKDRFRR
ncbi:MAG TPA: P1 family peptidase [Xanthobacteraceae bacterium]|nr:P1 family peptidase [Xanthobacteraceae bacterium]